uniref:N-acetylglucosaminidase, alpha n=1 Tax=Seriola dumerili TaxID=41447 RepID=A0A3B4UW14_SERDU
MVTFLVCLSTGVVRHRFVQKYSAALRKFLIKQSLTSTRHLCVCVPMLSDTPSVHIQNSLKCFLVCFRFSTAASQCSYILDPRDPLFLQIDDPSFSASPTCIWLMQGWLFFSVQRSGNQTRSRPTTRGAPWTNDRAGPVCRDRANLSYTESFYGQPFIWCMLNNFGGNSGFFGTVESINSGPSKALSKPCDVRVDERAGLAQRAGQLVQWASLYAIRRYGSTQENLTAAWVLLFASVYNCTVPHYRNNNHSPLVRRPSFHMNGGRWYDPADLYKSLETDYRGGSVLMSKETFRYDLVDVTRQVLQVLTTSFYQDILLVAGGVLVYDILPELNRLLNSDRNFLLGTWLERARSLGLDEKEAQLYDMNARNQLTLWGPSGEILDYASKEWGGLMEDYYAQRWGLFVNMLQDTFNQAAFQVEKGFVYNGRKYPTKPQETPMRLPTGSSSKYYPQALKRL